MAVRPLVLMMPQRKRLACFVTTQNAVANENEPATGIVQMRPSKHMIAGEFPCPLMRWSWLLLAVRFSCLTAGICAVARPMQNNE